MLAELVKDWSRRLEPCGVVFQLSQRKATYLFIPYKTWCNVGQGLEYVQSYEKPWLPK